MGQDRVEATLRTAVKKHARLDVGTVEPDHALSGDLGFDSLAFLMLLSDLEDSFDVEFPLERIEELRDLTFGELTTLVRGRLKESSSPELAGGTQDA